MNLGPVRIKSPDTHIIGTAVGGGFKPQAETCSADAFSSGIVHDFTREAFQLGGQQDGLPAIIALS